jgi:hypothetical protein
MSGPRSRVWQGVWHTGPVFAYVALIFVFGSMRLHGPEGPQMPSDKVMHLVAFGGMQLFMFRAVRWRWTQLGLSAQLLRAAALCAAAGALLEFYQAFLPHRSAELADWLADMLGVALASGLLVLAIRLPLPLGRFRGN